VNAPKLCRSESKNNFIGVPLAFGIFQTAVTVTAPFG